MGTELDTSSGIEHESSADTEISVSAPGAQAPDTARRRFARNAVVGSAVFLSLGNRAAWGQTQICAPTSVFMSLDLGLASIAPSGRSEQWELEHNNAQIIHDANQPDNTTNYEPVPADETPAGQICVREKPQAGLTTFEGPLTTGDPYARQRVLWGKPKEPKEPKAK